MEISQSLDILLDMLIFITFSLDYIVVLWEKTKVHLLTVVSLITIVDDVFMCGHILTILMMISNC